MMICLVGMVVARWGGEGGETVNPICDLYPNIYVFYVYFRFIIFFLYIFLYARAVIQK